MSVTKERRYISTIYVLLECLMKISFTKKKIGWIFIELFLEKLLNYFVLWSSKFRYIKFCLVCCFSFETSDLLQF